MGLCKSLDGSDLVEQRRRGTSWLGLLNWSRCRLGSWSRGRGGRCWLRNEFRLQGWHIQER
jgi:hypothetical protein